MEPIPHKAVAVEDEKYGKMLEFHTPASPHFSEKYPTRLGYKKLLNMLLHFEAGTVRQYLESVCPADVSLVDANPPPANATAEDVAEAIASAPAQHEDADGVIDDVPF